MKAKIVDVCHPSHFVTNSNEFLLGFPVTRGQLKEQFIDAAISALLDSEIDWPNPISEFAEAFGACYSKDDMNFVDCGHLKTCDCERVWCYVLLRG